MLHTVAQSDIVPCKDALHNSVKPSDKPFRDQAHPAYLNLHGIAVELRVSSASLLAYCRSLLRHYMSFFETRPGIVLELELVDSLSGSPSPPTATTLVSQLRGIVCTADRQRLFLDFDGKGAFTVDRLASTITGQVVPVLLTEQHLLDRLLVGSLALLLRDWSIFPVHGFSAAWKNQAALLVGAPGCGKTTAGLALVRRKWGFLANDLSLLSETEEGIHVLSCPERVHATVETSLFFPELQSLADGHEGKFGFHVEDVYEDTLVARAPVRWLLFPHVGRAETTRLIPLSASEALIALLPHSMVTWDRSVASTQFSLLERLVRSTPAYHLELGRDVEEWPSLLAESLAEST